VLSFHMQIIKRYQITGPRFVQVFLNKTNEAARCAE
jgi:hypothetical protein